MSEIADILDLLASRPNSPAVLATVLAVEGSSYRLPGARLLWLPDGARRGSISGGCLEEDLIEHARRVLATGRPETLNYDTAAENDLVWGTGSGCAGRVRVFVESIPAARPPWITALGENQRARRDTALAVVHQGDLAPGTRLARDLPARVPADAVFTETIAAPPRLVIFGAGDDAQPLVRLARELGWQTVVADSRAALATGDRFPTAASVVVTPPESAVAAVGLDPATLAVVMTHRFRDDVALLRDLLPRPLAYLGLLGPLRRAKRVLAEIERQGLAVTPPRRARLHAPVGLDLGGDSPETIALAIMAEIQCRRAGRAPIHLRDRTAPIHG